MTRQNHSSHRLIRARIVPDPHGPIVYRDGKVHSRIKDAFDFSGMPEVHVISRGAVRVAYSVAGIWCEAGHDHHTVRIGEGPTQFDGLPLVALACLQAARLRLGIPLLSAESEDEFLRECAPVGSRPLSRRIETNRARRNVARTLPRSARAA